MKLTKKQRKHKKTMKMFHRKYSSFIYGTMIEHGETTCTTYHKEYVFTNLLFEQAKGE